MFFSQQTCEHIGKMLLDKNGYGIAIGLLSSWVIAIFFEFFFVTYSNRYLYNKAKVNFENKYKQNTYPLLYDKWFYWVNNSELGKPNLWLGLFEMTLFYICLLVNKPEGIGAWLVFKVAAKWEAWANITKFPEKMEGIGDSIYLELRNDLATSVLQKFLIGTILHILIAFIGVAIFFFIRIMIITEGLMQKFWLGEIIGIVVVLIGMIIFKHYIIDRLPKRKE